MLIDDVLSGIFKSTCPVSITWFPFDNQTCTLKFGTWTYTEELVNLTIQDSLAGNASYQENAEWVLLSARGVRNAVEYECCKGRGGLTRCVMSLGLTEADPVPPPS